MTPEQLKAKVDAIIATGGEPRYDDEAAHSEEDDLHLELIGAFCPDWVQAEIHRLNGADFCRWCA